MRSKYLEDIGIQDWLQEDDERIIDISSSELEAYTKIAGYRNHQSKYGIDPRECYNMESAVYEHIYCLLMQFKIDAAGIINLHYHSTKYNGIAWYQDEVIDRCLNALKQYLMFQENFNDTYCWGEPLYKEAKDSLHLLIESLYYMWW